MTPLERRVFARAARTPGGRLRMLVHDRADGEALVRLIRAGMVRVSGDPLRVVGVSLDAATAAGSHTATADTPDDQRRAAVAAACRPLSAQPAPALRTTPPAPRACPALEPCPECGEPFAAGTGLASHRRSHERQQPGGRGPLHLDAATLP